MDPSPERFPVPAAPLSRINPAFLRARVAYASNEKPGTIVVDPGSRYLYFVEEGGRAMRYGVGVRKEGFAWSGTAVIHDKQEWPDWYPPKEMIQRRPDLRPQLTELQSGIGVPGGPSNPHLVEGSPGSRKRKGANLVAGFVLDPDLPFAVVPERAAQVLQHLA